MPSIETVVVQGENGPVVCNKGDEHLYKKKVEEKPRIVKKTANKKVDKKES